MSAVDIIDGRGYILNVEFGGGKDGVDGKDGRDGVAPDLQIGTVKESEDDQPHVTISNEGDGKLSLNFDLVSGQDGQNGEDGGIYIPSVSQEGVISWIAPEGQQPPQAVNVKGETGATFTPTVSIGGEISWTNDKGLDNPNEQNIRGPKGEKGDPFTIYKVYNSKAEMDADYSNPDVPMGAFVCITNSVDQSENARLYVKGTQQYTFITDLSGATGIQGVPGVGIGRVSLMDDQPSPLYKEYGVWSDQTPEVLLGTFNLPVGEDGQQGSDGVGIRSVVQTVTSTADNGRNEITVTLTNDNTSKFYVENGSKGSTGAQGPAGQNGKDGKDGVGIDNITVEQSAFDGQANVVTLHLSDETTKTFNVYNGHTGATGTAGTLNTNNTSAAIPTSESMSGNISLHKISKTGNYNDLLNKPTIPAAANDSLITIQKNGATVNTFTLNQSSPKIVNIPIPTTVAELSDASNYVLASSLATVATSGSYYDLDDTPIIGNAELTIRSADNATPETYTEIGKFHANAANPEYITLSKVARTGNYGDLKNIQQSDWAETDTSNNAFILNKPTFYGSQFINPDDTIFPSGSTEHLFGVEPANRQFHVDIIGDYFYIKAFDDTISEGSYNAANFMSFGYIGSAVVDSVYIHDDHPTSYTRQIAYDKICTLRLKKDSLYKLSITQYLMHNSLGVRKISAKSPKMAFFIDVTDNAGKVPNLRSDSADPSINNTYVDFMYEYSFNFDQCNVYITTCGTLIRNDGNYSGGGNKFGITTYCNVTKDPIDVDPNGLNVYVDEDDVSWLYLNFGGKVNYITKSNLELKMSRILDGTGIVGNEFMPGSIYVVDDGDYYFLLFIFPSLADFGYTSDDRGLISDNGVKRIILGIDGEEVIPASILNS